MREESVIFGADGFPVSADSNIPWILITSGVFNEISSSWTLVPHGKVPYSNPSLNVVVPIPEPSVVDLVTIKESTFSSNFSFAFGFNCLTVVINCASVSFAPKL